MKYSALAGSLAALAGTLGKLGADGNSNALGYINAQCKATDSLLASLGVSCDMMEWVLRAVSIALMLATNALMLNFFVRGLHETDSLTATVTSAAVNFMFSAIAGLVVFGEHLPLQWFVGATIILVGVGFLLHGDSPLDDEHDKQS